MERLIERVDEVIARGAVRWVRQGPAIEVELWQRAARQRVLLAKLDDHYRFWSVAAPAALVTRSDPAWRDLAYRVWRKNDVKEVVGFCFDRKDRLLGVIEQPVETVDHEEIEFYVDLLARECDRFKYKLSGKDQW